MSAFRTPDGGRVDRAKPIGFSFDGRTLAGLQGDTLASALLANGIHLTGRSFKYHRPRGILASGTDEPNALVTISRDAARTVPNLPAPAVALYDGLVAESQNRSPSLAFDVNEVNDLAGRFLPAGFYYKTFMWPRSWWHRVYEPRIREMAGLGRAPTLPDPDRYIHRHAHCDVLVVGAGPAGLAAALSAADAGARVILCDEQAECGGSLLAETEATIDGQPAAQWMAAALATLGANERVTVLPRTTAFGWYPHNLIGLLERVTDHLSAPDAHLPRERMWQVRAQEVVLATGAIERPMVFPDNDRPGIMLADAARTYLARYGVRPGTRAVVAAGHDDAYRAAVELHRAGVAIALIADVRTEVAGEWPGIARAAGIEVRTGCVVTGTAGRLRVRAAKVATVRDGVVGPSERIACDLLLMSGGWTPSVHLFSQSKGRLRWDPELLAFLPNLSVARERSAGACHGVFGLAGVLADGAAAGADAAHATGLTTTPRPYGVEHAPASAGGFIGAAPHGRKAVKAFVDFQNDVTAKDLLLATREGFVSIEHVKRYTTTGMATDQGKTSNINAIAIVAEATGKTPPEIGTTTFRPPYTPVTFGAFAGLARGTLFDPVRTTPIHGWADANGAAFEDVGTWKRAHYFPAARETLHDAVARETRAVRTEVGLFDASTLGKIEIVGPDAAEFMNRMYVNAWTRLAVGRCRYGVMLREDGFVMDDGVVGRLARDRFHVTTTTGGAPRVLAFMEDYLQTEFSELDVWLTSVTEQWAVIAVQGPRAREVLAPFVEADISADAFPHMSVVETRFAGIKARVFRVSFSGELGFEVNVPADYGRAAWEALIAGGVTPYGTEAMHVLRAEKGYIIVGQETDGTATPDDAGLAGLVGKQKPDFVGMRSLRRAGMAEADRKQLVGLLTEDPHVVLEEGAQLVDPDRPGSAPIGHVTSAYHSAVLGHSIALAMVSAGRSRTGHRLLVPMPGGGVPVQVTAPVFYDPDGARIHA